MGDGPQTLSPKVRAAGPCSCADSASDYPTPKERLDRFFSGLQALTSDSICND